VGKDEKGDFEGKPSGGYGVNLLGKASHKLTKAGFDTFAKVL